MSRLFKYNRQKGFTIIEAVVASGVFAFVVASALGIYMAVMQLDGKTRSERAVHQNTRFIMDYFAKEIRNGSIDYTATNDSDTLTLVNQLGQQEIFNYNTAGCNGGAGSVSACSVQLTKTGIGTTSLNSADVRVTRLRFYLNPNVDPFDLANDVHVQPHVTVVMRIESVNLKNTERGYIDVQSTFTVRDYPSRR
jgi:hypothetical protein